MKIELTLVEVIGLAIRSEEDAAHFYGEVVKVIKNESVRVKYESLAREEIGHRHMLVELYKKMTGSPSAPPRIPGSPKTAEGGMPPFAVEALEDLLRLAIRREQEAGEFYRRAAVQSPEDNARRTFDHLAEIEHGHEILLKSELDSYLKDRDWYAEKPDIQLVGP